MNYQFSKSLYGAPYISFDMGQEALALWFNNELGTNLLLSEQVIEVIKQLEQKNIQEYVFEGKEIDLVFNQYEVEARSTLLAIEPSDDLPEGTELYDSELSSGCGLVDFKHVLLAWTQFIRT